MARIGFIGLGNMGLPMAQNLIKAGHQVEGVDVNPASVEKLKAAGGAAVDMPGVAAVGLWLAAAWGAVIWLMSVASMLALEVFFPQVFGASIFAGLLELGLLCLYLFLALKAAREHPP